MTLSSKGRGAWLVHHTKKLDIRNRPGDYPKIRIAGKAGILLSALSEDSQSTLTNQTVANLARASGVDTAFELPLLLEKLQAQLLIDRTATGIEVLGITSGTVLQHTADIFSAVHPSDEEEAALSLAEKCSEEPQPGARLGEFLRDSHQITKTQANALLDDATEIGFSDAEAVGDETLYFNGSIFRQKEIQKTHKVLSSLTERDQRAVKQLDAQLASGGCTSHAEAEVLLGVSLFEKLLSIGMYELSEVSNSIEQAVYVMKPSSFCKFGSEPTDDAFELARALVASLSYGMNRSSYGRGKIRMIELLLGKLIAGGAVGPATAIGEDYKILELKKVVSVFRQEYGFSMRLLKKEIGQIALAAITQGDASEHSLDLHSAAVTTYRGPEEKRTEVRQRKNLSMKKNEFADILQSLRSGR